MIENTTYQGIPFKPEFDADGIFGIGRQTAGGSSFISRAVAAGLIESTTWAYQPSTDDEKGEEGDNGAIVLGGYNETALNGTLTWNSVPQGDQWISDLQDVTINGTSVWNTSVVAQVNSTATFVTGYKYLGLPADAFYGVCSQLQSYIATTNFTNTTVTCDPGHS